jgi:hypothetical protein
MTHSMTAADVGGYLNVDDPVKDCRSAIRR